MLSDLDSARVDRFGESLDADSQRCEDRESCGRNSIPFGLQNLNTGDMDFFEEIRLSFSMKKQPSLGQQPRESESADSTSRSELPSLTRVPLNQLAKSVYPPSPFPDCLPHSIYKQTPASPPFPRLLQGFPTFSGLVSPIHAPSHAKNKSCNSSFSSFENPELPGDFPGKLGRIKEVSYENSFSKPPDLGQSVQRLPSVKEAPVSAPQPQPAVSACKASTPQKKSLDLRSLRRRFLDKSKQSFPQMERFTRTVTKEPTEE